MPYFSIDLHIHTVLSPCAEEEMFPELILERVQELGIDLIAVTDHNSCENAPAVMNAARGTGIVVWPGMEVQTREDVHLVCVFDRLEQALAWQQQVYANLPPLQNRPSVFGTQVSLDEQGDIVGYNERLLATSTFFSVDEVVRRVRGLGGLCIPAHVDRPANSIIANLGFVPPHLAIPAVEISHLIGPKEARARYGQLAGYGLVACSDAHRLDDMRRRTTVKMAGRSVEELVLAVSGQGDRGVWVDGVRTIPESR